jgi:thiol:disulfide interchange protein DsbC
MKISLPILLLSLLVTLQPASAADPGAEKVTEILKTVMPKSTPDSVQATGIPGLYEAVYGAQIIYISADGRYMFEGDLYDIQARVNLTEEKRQGGRIKAIDAIDESSMILFAPADGKAKYVITAFTDIDCGYCRKLHGQIAEYNKLGIEVRYLAYPRAGIGSPSYEKAEAVWCAVDRKNAITIAKAGATLEQLKALKHVDGDDCKKPLRVHMEAAREVGVSGTPTLVMENGQVLPGYVPPDRIIKILDSVKKAG